VSADNKIDTVHKRIKARSSVIFGYEEICHISFYLQLGDWYEGRKDVCEIVGPALHVSVHGISRYGETIPSAPNKCVYDAREMAVLKVLNKYNSENVRVGSVKRANRLSFANSVKTFWGLEGAQSQFLD
jgi:hypothetical protein